MFGALPQGDVVEAQGRGGVSLVLSRMISNISISIGIIISNSISTSINIRTSNIISNHIKIIISSETLRTFGGPGVPLGS